MLKKFPLKRLPGAIKQKEEPTLDEQANTPSTQQEVPDVKQTAQQEEKKKLWRYSRRIMGAALLSIGAVVAGALYAYQTIITPQMSTLQMRLSANNPHKPATTADHDAKLVIPPSVPVSATTPTPAPTSTPISAVPPVTTPAPTVMAAAPTPNLNKASIQSVSTPVSAVPPVTTPAPTVLATSPTPNLNKASIQSVSTPVVAEKQMAQATQPTAHSRAKHKKKSHHHPAARTETVAMMDAAKNLAEASTPQEISGAEKTIVSTTAQVETPAHALKKLYPAHPKQAEVNNTQAAAIQKESRTPTGATSFVNDSGAKVGTPVLTEKSAVQKNNAALPEDDLLSQRASHTGIHEDAAVMAATAAAIGEASGASRTEMTQTTPINETLRATTTPSETTAAISSVVSTVEGSDLAHSVAVAQELWHQNEGDAAINSLYAVLDKVLREGDTSSPSLLPLVETLSDMLAFKEKTADLLALLELIDPFIVKTPKLWAMQGEAAYELGNYEESARSYLRAMDLNSGEQRWMLAAAVSLTLLHMKDSAKSLVDQAQQIGPIESEVIEFFKSSGLKITETVELRVQ